MKFNRCNSFIFWICCLSLKERLHSDIDDPFSSDLYILNMSLFSGCELYWTKQRCSISWKVVASNLMEKCLSINSSVWPSNLKLRPLKDKIRTDIFPPQPETEVSSLLDQRATRYRSNVNIVLVLQRLGLGVL